MEEVKNSNQEQNKLDEQRNTNNNKASMNLNDKNNVQNNKKEKNDYKSFLKKHDRSLYESFCSELFSIELLLDYLIHKEDQNIIDFLVDLLYKRFQNDMLYYLPQLCSLTMANIIIILSNHS